MNYRRENEFITNSFSSCEVSWQFFEYFFTICYFFRVLIGMDWVTIYHVSQLSGQLTLDRDCIKKKRMNFRLPERTKIFGRRRRFGVCPKDDFTSLSLYSS